MTRPILVAGNWKMHLLADEADALAIEVALAAGELTGPDVAVFPSATLIGTVRAALDESRVTLGAQACHEAAKGAHTGETSAAMVADAGCTAMLAGHSERRAAGATDEQVGLRVRAGLDAGLRVIACLGEQLADREAEATNAVLDRQLTAILAEIDESDLASLDLAYEPVWAIGTGRTATPEIASEAHRHLRARMVEKFGESGNEPRILYGGSVKPANVSELLAAPGVGGVLVGGASLDGASFRALIEAAHTGRGS